MQGQRSSIGSLPETLGFDHGSTSSDPVIEPQICWNNMRNTSQNDANVTYITSVNQEGPNLSGWNIGEPSSSGTQTHIVHNNERKIEHNWLSSMNDCNGSGPIFEDRQYEPSNNLSLNNASNIINISDSAPQDLNMSSGFVGPIIIDDTQEMDIPIPAPDNVPNYLEENEGRRLSCKRKALEGQSSASGSSSYFHRGEGSVWHPGYANRNGNNGLSISEVNPRLGLGVGGVGSESRPSVVVAQSVENSRRNLRLRINASSNQQDSIISNSNNVFSSPHHHLLRLNPFNNLDSAAPPPLPLPAPAMAAATETVITQGPRRSLQSSRWSRGSSSRSGGFLESSADEETNSRTIRSNFSEHQVFVPPAQSVVDWSFNSSGNLIVNGSNGSSTSRGTGPSSNVNQVSPAVPPNWVPNHRHSSHYPRRLRELVHRSLIASESGVQNGNFAAASSSQELPPSSGAQGRHVSHSRAAMLLDRQQHEGAFGIPYPMRTLGSTGEGRSRLVSEHIRNVLDLMRRGEGLRFEDVMILDQSVFFGMAADIHDRHRDMRLDVDNMSYEELLALEERIGNVNTGLSEKIILASLKQSKYVFVSTDLVEPEPCCVCQEEYNNGDDLGTLDCGHDFHSDCIKQWLTHKNICPICKTTALIT